MLESIRCDFRQSHSKTGEEMAITIPVEFTAFVKNALASGRYRSETEMIVDALSLLRERERRLDALRDDVRSGLEELDRGDSVPLDIQDIKRRGRQALSEQTRV